MASSTNTWAEILGSGGPQSTTHLMRGMTTPTLSNSLSHLVLFVLFIFWPEVAALQAVRMLRRTSPKRTKSLAAVPCTWWWALPFLPSASLASLFILKPLKSTPDCQHKPLGATKLLVNNSKLCCQNIN